ncbi:MAG: nuclear transport factor 2 family protein [candidate division KSB1 bacterium]|nr:nuclear transport factor 2 family protein [candidate division KSB1 bacterium]
MHLARVEAAARAALKFCEAFNSHDLGALAQLVDDRCVLEHADSPLDGPTIQGKEAVLGFWEQVFQRAPHARMEVEEVFGGGSRSVLRWQGEWPDATGRPVRTRGVEIFKVSDGLICEHLSYVKGR